MGLVPTLKVGAFSVSGAFQEFSDRLNFPGGFPLPGSPKISTECWKNWRVPGRLSSTPEVLLEILKGAIGDHRQEAQPPRGKLAWGRLKETAHDQRNWWLEVGAALAAGKNQHNRPVVKTDSRGRHYFQKFSDWVKENFPGICTKHEVDAAIWFATEFPQSGEKMLPPGLTHPRLIRQWLNEQPKDDTPPPFDLETPPVPQPPVLAPRDAEKVIKRRSAAPRSSSGPTTVARGLTSQPST